MGDRDHIPPGRNHETTLKVHIAPLLREALAAVQPGEDFDEALLRVLKLQHPDQAAALLSAHSRILQLEFERTGEDKSQIIRRLAESDPGPEIVLKTSGDQPRRTSMETRTFRVGDKEYHSLEEMPPDLRRAFERGMAGKRTTVKAPRVGCSWSLLAASLLPLLRLLWQ